MIDHRLDVVTPLTPGTAVAAIITVKGDYLLQLRDNIPGIFFPGHWGCFGGGVDPGEALETAVARELNEELGLSLGQERIRPFNRIDFTLDFAGLAPLARYFYEVTLDPTEFARLRLGEGHAMKLFGAADILTTAMPMTPYDAFALWLHINRSRLRQ